MNVFEMSNAILFHPVDTFEYIKSRQKSISIISCILLLFAVVVVRIASIFIVHYPIASIQPRDANIWLEIVKLLLPVLTWVISCYAITAISDGETLLREIFSAAVFSMIPYIVCTIPLAIITRVMGRDQLQLYNTLNNIILIWVLIIIFLSVRTLNDYTIVQTVKVCIISFITMLLIWAVLTLIFALTSQLIQFLCNIVRELRMIVIE
ncbi:MAG TPA: YIP1 family protein [Clostridiales bacterium]|nr:YIP1 family protein [Clostridiales bacterium]